MWRPLHRIVSLLVLFVACGVVAIALVRQPATSSDAAAEGSGGRLYSAAATTTLPRKASLASGLSVTPPHPVYLPFVPNVARMALTLSCSIQSIVPYNPLNNSGFVPNDGTFLNGQLLSSEPDSNGYYQIFSTHAGDKRCLTCIPPANAPTVDRFKRFPMWVTTPQGNFIQFTAEDSNGPPISKNKGLTGMDQIHLNNGYWSNIWAMNEAGT